MSTTHALAIELGGTRLRVGMISPRGLAPGAYIEHMRKPALVTQCHKMIDELQLRTPGLWWSDCAVGLALAAPISQLPDIEHSSSLHGQPGVDDLIQTVGERLGSEPTLVNDANAAALAEVRLGAARGRCSVVACYVGTGIGGALLLDGALYSGSHGIAGEIGHITCDPRGPECACGSRGCIELYASGAALARRSGSPASARSMAEQARQGDETCRALFAEAGHRLGMALATVVKICDPEALLLGGGLTASSALWLPALTASLHEWVTATVRSREPCVMLSEMGPQAGVIGAGLLALDSFAQ